MGAQHRLILRVCVCSLPRPLSLRSQPRPGRPGPCGHPPPRRRMGLGRGRQQAAHFPPARPAIPLSRLQSPGFPPQLLGSLSRRPARVVGPASASGAASMITAGVCHPTGMFPPRVTPNRPEAPFSSERRWETGSRGSDTDLALPKQQGCTEMGGGGASAAAAHARSQGATAGSRWPALPRARGGGRAGGGTWAGWMLGVQQEARSPESPTPNPLPLAASLHSHPHPADAPQDAAPPSPAPSIPPRGRARRSLAQESSPDEPPAPNPGPRGPQAAIKPRHLTALLTTATHFYAPAPAP